MSNVNQDKVFDFINRNKTVAVVSGYWMDKRRREVRGNLPPHEWVFLCYTLEDGSKVVFNRAELDMYKGLHPAQPMWVHDKEDA